METSKKYRSVELIVEVLSVSLQLIAIVSPGWVGELHPQRSFYSSLFYGVVCESRKECNVRSHFTTYISARRDNATDTAVADVWYFRVVMVQVAALVALILSLLLLGLELLKAKIKHNLHYFIVMRPIMLSITDVLQLTVVANMWIGYDFNTRLSSKNIFPYSLITYAVSLVLTVIMTSYFTRQLVTLLKIRDRSVNGRGIGLP